MRGARYAGLSLDSSGICRNRPTHFPSVNEQSARRVSTSHLRCRPAQVRAGRGHSRGRLGLGWRDPVPLDPLVERGARDSQARAQTRRLQFASLDGAVDRPGRQTGEGRGLGRTQEDRLVLGRRHSASPREARTTECGPLPRGGCTRLVPLAGPRPDGDDGKSLPTASGRCWARTSDLLLVGASSCCGLLPYVARAARRARFRT